MSERQVTIMLVGRVIERLILVFAGIFCIYIGYLLYVGGVSGDLNFRVQTAGQEYQLENAAPGIVMAILGTFVLVRASTATWTRIVEEASGAKDITIYSEALEDTQAHKRSPRRDQGSVERRARLRGASATTLEGDEITSLYRLLYDVFEGKKKGKGIDCKVISSEDIRHLHSAYGKVYRQLSSPPDEISPVRLPDPPISESTLESAPRAGNS